jgi:hypothetical protein
MCNASENGTRPVREFPSTVSPEVKARSDRVLEFIGDDSQKMIRAANQYLIEKEKRAVNVDIDPKTDKIILPGQSKWSHVPVKMLCHHAKFFC